MARMSASICHGRGSHQGCQMREEKGLHWKGTSQTSLQWHGLISNNDLLELDEDHSIRTSVISVCLQETVEKLSQEHYSM